MIRDGRFPENFAVRSFRITDAKVLSAPMELVKGEVRSPGESAEAEALT
jgi:hypothetical protein